jgi:DNA repair ATPase RecN
MTQDEQTAAAEPAEPTEATPEDTKEHKDLLARLADAGEEALRRFADAPGMERAAAYAKSTRKQVDDLTKRVQGISALEERIAKLEKQVAALAKDSPKRTPARKSTP